MNKIYLDLKWLHRGLNPGPPAHETGTLPLSYGAIILILYESRSTDGFILWSLLINQKPLI